MGERLIPVPIPPLWMKLRDLESSKGAPLTETEVVEARDAAVCIVMAQSRAEAWYEKTGFFDVEPSDVWADWQRLRLELAKPSRQE